MNMNERIKCFSAVFIAERSVHFGYGAGSGLFVSTIVEHLPSATWYLVIPY